MSAHEVVDAFTRAWAAPDAERFVSILADDVILRAPLVEPSVGLDAAYEEFARLLYVWPDVHGVVERWAAAGNVVFIEWRMEGEFAGRRLSFPVVDRIVFRGSLIAEREMFGDGLTIAQPFLRSPSRWPRVWRSGIAPARIVRRLMRATTSSRRFRRPAALPKWTHVGGPFSER